MPLLDTPENRKAQRKNTACTIQDLVEASAAGLMGRQVYNYSDFAYCKHLGKIPNNYLITLRRFGAPCGDRIDIRPYSNIIGLDKQLQQHMPDIGRLITWIGTPGNEMSNILKYSYGVQWEDLEAKLEDVDGHGDDDGSLASLFNMANSFFSNLFHNSSRKYPVRRIIPMLKNTVHLNEFSSNCNNLLTSGIIIKVT